MRGLFQIDVHDGVYPPSEDTYLLLDMMDFEAEDSVLDVGCGAGLGTVFAASIVRRVVGIDISLEAVRNTAANLRRNNQKDNAGVIQSDLLSAISSKCKFSIIMFNPPYLPADDNTTTMDHMHIGGNQGSELTQRFVHQAPQFLIEGGRLFIVVSTLANTGGVVKTLEDSGFEVRYLAEKSLFFEKIQVIKGIFRGHKETVL
ncbi:MAG: HemK2/MTQ2 family protein methyltransferase [Candidatus Odinarchaeota archaeon]